METMRVRLTFIDSILGTAPGDPEIHATYVASKAPDALKMEEEIEAFGVDEVVEKGKTFFDRTEDGQPCLYNYQIQGFFKAACGALRKVKGTKSEKVKAYKKLIDTNIFVFPDANNKAGRKIPINFEGEITSCQRPLRASTPQGERVALANSEEIPAGATIEFDIELFNASDKGLVEEWLDYGQYNGLGQWRNSGHGAYLWNELDMEGNIIGGNNGIFTEI